MAEDPAVVLVALRIAGVEERVLPRQPRHAGRPGVRDLVRAVPAAGDVDHPQDAPLVTPLGDAVRDQRAARRRVVPVDRRRRVGHQTGGIDEQPSRRLGIVGRADDEDELLLPATPLEGEHPASGQAHSEGDRKLQQGDQPVQPGPTVGQGIERQARPLVLRLDPGGDLGRVAVLEPAIGIGHLPAVEHVHHIVPPGRRGRRQHHVQIRVASAGRSSTHVRALAVVGLGATHARLLLLGLLGHKGPAYGLTRTLTQVGRRP